MKFKEFIYDIILILCIIPFQNIYSQSPKRELRSVWLTTVWGIDWPKIKISSKDDIDQINAQKKELTDILDSLERCNMNAIYFQVRSRSDAKYKSSYEPWSNDIVSLRGNDPGYDPFEFIIEEAHQRGMELYAWVNPYRFENTKREFEGGAGDYAKTHPDWLVTVGNSRWFNPGIPEVRTYLCKIIAEIVRNYNLDGVLFDDYFYLSGIKDQDLVQQGLYKPEDLSVAEWRRENVNAFVKQVYDTIQNIKPFVKFGIGPAGIWGGDSKSEIKYNVTNPSGIGPGFAFNGIYCDPLAWLYEGSIDFISPQIYWTIGSTGTDFDTLSKWWSTVAHQFSKHCYVSHSLSDMTSNLVKGKRSNTLKDTTDLSGLTTIEKAAYLYKRVGSTKANMNISAFGFSEIYNQILLNRKYDLNDAPGSAFYSALPFTTTGTNVQYMRSNAYVNKAQTPAIFWKSHPEIGFIENLRISEKTLSWDDATINCRYSVYIQPKNSQAENILESSKYLYKVEYGNHITLPNYFNSNDYIVGVTILDRFGNEGPIKFYNQELSSQSKPTLLYPTGDNLVIIPQRFSWNKTSADSYFVELSLDPNFTKLYSCKETKNTFISANDLFPFIQGEKYYWRLRARKAGYLDALSDNSSFTYLPFYIVSPLNNSEEVSPQTNISWANAGNNTNYRIEIAQTNSFSPVLFSFNTTLTSYQLPEKKLLYNSSYFIRVIASIGDVSLTSKTVEFTTPTKIPEIPIILTPVEGEQCEDSEVCLSWNEDYGASKTRIEVSTSASFPPRGNTKIKSVDSYIYTWTFNDLTAGTWYARCLFYYGNDNLKTDWSSIRSFTVTDETSLNNTQLNKDAFIMESTLHYSILKQSQLKINLYSSTGKLISVLKNGIYKPGNYLIDLAFLNRGIYLIQIQIDHKNKMLKYIR